MENIFLHSRHNANIAFDYTLPCRSHISVYMKV